MIEAIAPYVIPGFFGMILAITFRVKPLATLLVGVLIAGSLMILVNVLETAYVLAGTAGTGIVLVGVATTALAVPAKLNTIQ